MDNGSLLTIYQPVTATVAELSPTAVAVIENAPHQIETPVTPTNIEVPGPTYLSSFTVMSNGVVVGVVHGVRALNFAGAGIESVVMIDNETAQINIAGGSNGGNGGGSSSLPIFDENVQVVAAASKINFVGPNVTAEADGQGGVTVSVVATNSNTIFGEGFSKWHLQNGEHVLVPAYHQYIVVNQLQMDGNADVTLLGDAELFILNDTDSFDPDDYLKTSDAEATYIPAADLQTALEGKTFRGVFLQGVWEKFVENEDTPASYTLPAWNSASGGNHVKLTLTEDLTTITLAAGPATLGTLLQATVRVTQDGTGGRTISFVAPGIETLKWNASGAMPAPNSDATKTTIYAFMKYAGDLTWFASQVWIEN